MKLVEKARQVLHLPPPRTMARFMVGAALYVPNTLLRRSQSDVALVSFDIFGTLIERIADEHNALRASALRTFGVARAYGLQTPHDAENFRRDVEREIFIERLAGGQTLEFTNETIIARMLMRLGGGAWAAEEAAKIARFELQEEIRCTRAHVENQARLQTYLAAGRRVIAISDTRYTAAELYELFAAHGIAGVSTIYASVDCGCSKYGGQLFEYVADREKILAKNILHIGDNLLSDILSASQKGLAVRWVAKPVAPPALPDAPHIAHKNPAHEFGYQLLGPVVVGFVRLILAQAYADDVEHLAFIARDGYLPYKTLQCLLEIAGNVDLPTASYVYLSRRATEAASVCFADFAQDQKKREALIVDMMGLRGPSNLITRLKNFYDIDGTVLQRECDRLRLHAGDSDELRRLLAEQEAAAALDDARRDAGKTFIDYLMQQKILCSKTALIDIGWRGSIHAIISRIARSRNAQIPRAYYFGFYDDTLGLKNRTDSHGLISDSRRGKTLLAGSAFQNVFLLEATFKSLEGMVTKFTADDSGKIAPELLSQGEVRQAEIDTSAYLQDVHEGALSYARWYATHHPLLVPDVPAIRHQIQKRLFNLAFYPSAAQRRVGRYFTHSEPTDDNQVLQLICDPEPGLRGWVAGVRSPWKGGYFRETSGVIGATAWLAFETLTCQLSGASKLWLRRVILGKHI